MSDLFGRSLARGGAPAIPHGNPRSPWYTHSPQRPARRAAPKNETPHTSRAPLVHQGHTPPPSSEFSAQARGRCRQATSLAPGMALPFALSRARTSRFALGVAPLLPPRARGQAKPRLVSLTHPPVSRPPPHHAGPSATRRAISRRLAASASLTDLAALNTRRRTAARGARPERMPRPAPSRRRPSPCRSSGRWSGGTRRSRPRRETAQSDTRASARSVIAGGGSAARRPLLTALPALSLPIWAR